jgi:hypothetical protein
VKIFPPELCAKCSGKPLDVQVFLTKFSANVCRIPSTCTLLAGISVRVPADEHDVPIPFVTLRLGLEAVLALQLLDQLVVTLDIFLRGWVGIDGRCRAILFGWTASSQPYHSVLVTRLRIGMDNLPTLLSGLVSRDTNAAMSRSLVVRGTFGGCRRAQYSWTLADLLSGHSGWIKRAERDDWGPGR